MFTRENICISTAYKQQYVERDREQLHWERDKRMVLVSLVITTESTWQNRSGMG